jgi:hypothetical protein
MRRLLTWVVVTLGIAAIVRRLRRRGQQNEIAPAADEGDDPADELRRKLAETRSEDELAEPAAASEATVEERRAGVHDEGRATLDEMRGPDEG